MTSPTFVPKFISASELAREAGCSTNKITAAVESGLLTPAGRSGNHKSAAMIFMRADLENLLAAIRLGGRAKGSVPTSRPHRCTNAAEVLAKGEALIRAREESK
jgi:hypothetical protein